ncbi:MAG: 3-dehydroquinate synthase [Spirochaetes bacterium]|nr:3-dehydroquinate synthase [Spirochaetota bacterium]
MNRQSNCKPLNTLFIADENTVKIAESIRGKENIPVCILKSGEENKNWQAVETILSAAKSAELGRDAVFIGVGGGVIGDLTGFAASVYMRGCRLVLAPTTLLAMVDASIGGKTGFDLFGVKNLAGSFYPAEIVYMPVHSLSTLPDRELKSGLAELIKTAILSGDDFFDMLAETKKEKLLNGGELLTLIEKSVFYKGTVTSEDFRESGKRALLNLGHTFGHALEAAAGLGSLSHGEAVAWGIIQSCALGLSLGITPLKRAEKIKTVISSFGFDCSCPNRLAATDAFKTAMKSDKKKKHGKMTFIIPDENSARIVDIEPNKINIVEKILTEGYIF